MSRIVAKPKLPVHPSSPLVLQVSDCINMGWKHAMYQQAVLTAYPVHGRKLTTLCQVCPSDRFAVSFWNLLRRVQLHKCWKPTPVDDMRTLLPCLTAVHWLFSDENELRNLSYYSYKTGDNLLSSAWTLNNRIRNEKGFGIHDWSASQVWGVE